MGHDSARSGFLAKLRELATQAGAVLIFDEVITGFRWSPGGAQKRFGITPDMTTMAKIVAGGMPGGAVAGSEEIMAYLEFRTDPAGPRKDHSPRHLQRQSADSRGRPRLPAQVR